MPTSNTVEIKRSIASETNQGPAAAPKTARQPEEVLRSIMDGLAETIFDATDEEVLKEASEQGKDPLKSAEQVRDLLLDASGASRTPKDTIHGHPVPPHDRCASGS